MTAATLADRSALVKLIVTASAAVRRWQSRNRVDWPRIGIAVLGFLLDLAGMGLLCVAAWLIAVPFGLAVAGVFCLVSSWYVTDRRSKRRGDAA